VSKHSVGDMDDAIGASRFQIMYELGSNCVKIDMIIYFQIEAALLISRSDFVDGVAPAQQSESFDVMGRARI
jgi:hypothetical protein